MHYGILHDRTGTTLAVHTSGRPVSYPRMGLRVIDLGLLIAHDRPVIDLTFLLWVSGSDPKIKRWPLYVCMAVQVVVNFVQVFLALAQCGTHLSALWDFTIGYYTFCWNPIIQTYYGYFSGCESTQLLFVIPTDTVSAVNTVADLFLTVYPAIIVQHVALTLKSKIGLWLLLCLSFK